VSAIGQELSRRDGPAKVSGEARYTADISLARLAHAALVGATIACGRVASRDASAALALDDVVAVLTPDDLPKISGEPHLLPSLVGGPAPGMSFFPMQDDRIHYAGQPVAIVVAESEEAARYGASLVRVEYDEEPCLTTIAQGRDDAYEPEKLFGGLLAARMEHGDIDAAIAEADIVVEGTFHMAANHHNPLEWPATTAVWDGDQLTIYDSTHALRAVQLTVAQLLGLPLASVRVVTQYVGGSFGSKAMVWPHVTLAALAAREVRRPLRLTLSRLQMFTATGHREEQEQRLLVAATRDGAIKAIRHEKLSVTSPFDDWAEPATGSSGQLYESETFQGFHRLIRGNTMTPTFTRGPGETVGSFVLEAIIDELAEQLAVDPVELRLNTHAPADGRGNAWSSDGLAECLERGAERFGWKERAAAPRLERDGDWLIGRGMAVAAYPIALFMPTQHARARIYGDGSAIVETGTPEFGSGVGTMMVQVAADALGLPVEHVRYRVGDSDLPNTSAAVGSSGAMMVSSAVLAAATALRQKLVGMAVADEDSPLHGAQPEEVGVDGGRMLLAAKKKTGETYQELLERHHLADAEALGSWQPPPMDGPHGLMTFGAQFAEVAVDAELGLVRARRLVGAFAPGKVINPKLARSQLMGGMLWGLSQALLEGNAMDERFGRWAATSLGDYLVPVNADAPEVEVELVEVDDELTPLGVKGVGEIGQVGVAAAIANAVYNATGRRVRQLPIAPELVMPS
jgi:xanthine dehydrogenase YagR molybdenum-binding subunit